MIICLLNGLLAFVLSSDSSSIGSHLIFFLILPLIANKIISGDSYLLFGLLCR